MTYDFEHLSQDTLKKPDFENQAPLRCLKLGTQYHVTFENVGIYVPKKTGKYPGVGMVAADVFPVP